MLVKTLPHHDQSRWTCTSDYVEEKVSISIITKMDQIRAEHVAFISLLARYNNEVYLSVCLYLFVALFVCLFLSLYIMHASLCVCLSVCLSAYVVVATLCLSVRVYQL